MNKKDAYSVAELDISLRLERMRDRVPADLLIPADLLQYACLLKKRKGEWRDVVAYLVSRHCWRVLQAGQKAANIRFRYQNNGLKLHRICYAPYRDGIAELRMLSYAARISMCALIVLMLEWEQSAEGELDRDIFIGTTWDMHGSWVKEEGILIIRASIQQPSTHHPP